MRKKILIGITLNVMLIDAKVYHQVVEYIGKKLATGLYVQNMLICVEQVSPSLK